MAIQSERSFPGLKFNNMSRDNWKPLFKVNFSKNSTKTIRLFALHFYEVIVELYRNTRESLGELEKAVEHSPAARVPTVFLVLLNLHSCFYNLIETRKMFSIS